jgi:hypothetical protein
VDTILSLLAQFFWGHVHARSALSCRDGGRQSSIMVVVSSIAALQKINAAKKELATLET